MLTDAEYAAWKSIPDLTEKLEDEVLFYRLKDIAEDSYTEDLSMDAWKRALCHAAELNEEHYENHLSFRVLKVAQKYYVVDKALAEKKLGLDLSAPLPIL